MFFKAMRASGKEPGKQAVSADFVKWAYRILLHRDVETRAIVEHVVASGMSETDFVWRIVRSLEFSRGASGTRLATGNWRPQDAAHVASLAALIANFKQYDGPSEPGFYMDFLGVRTRPHYVPDTASYGNRIAPLPTDDQPLLFEPAEWEGTLRSVLEARERLVAIELGAGWAPWLVSCHAAARQRGVRDIKLVGVEASPEHFAFMKQHLCDNGIDPAQHELFQGVVGTTDGFAYFPRLPDAQQDWGAQAVSGAGSDEETLQDFVDYRGTTFGKMDRVPCLALTTLLRRHARVDIIHCDIQDSEGEVLPSAIGELTARVRRVVVGTHSRKSEGALLEAFTASGWVAEADKPCRYVVENGRIGLLNDGVQVWANPRLVA